MNNILSNPREILKYHIFIRQLKKQPSDIANFPDFREEYNTLWRIIASQFKIKQIKDGLCASTVKCPCEECKDFKLEENV